MLMFFIPKFALSVITNIHSREDNFLNILLCDLLGIFNNIFYRIRTGNPSRHRNCTISTFVITPILNFQKGTSPIPNRIRTYKEICIFYFARVNLRRTFGLP